MQRTFSNIDALISRLFWNTKDTLFINVSFGISRISISPIKIRPFCGSKNLVILFTRSGVTNELLLNLIFYIVITPVIGTTLTKIMFMSADALYHLSKYALSVGQKIL